MAKERHPQLSWLSQGPLEELVVADLKARDIPRTVADHWSQVAEHAALARIADHSVAEDVAVMRTRPVGRRPYTWAEIGDELGVSAQAAQQRFGSLPPPPEVTVHRAGGTGKLCIAHLRRDRTAWGCACGAAGELD